LVTYSTDCGLPLIVGCDANAHHWTLYEERLAEGECNRSIGNLNVLQLNARSIKSDSKMASLSLFLSMVKVNLDVIVIGETWLSPGIKNLFLINGFNSLKVCERWSTKNLTCENKN
jgi:hypothetical protein